MTREEALAKLQIIIDRNDWNYENGHYEADQILCRLLEELGYSDVVEKYDNINKWYA